jgi:hypothetical protein
MSPGGTRPRDGVETASVVRPTDDPGALVLLAFCGESTQRFDLARAGEVTIGRAPDCALRVDHPSVSRRHARVHVGPRLAIEDLGGRNGTRVRGVLLAPHHRAPLHPGDVVECGEAMLIVRQAPLEPSSSAARGAKAAVAGEEALTIGAEARWFQTWQAERVNLGRRGPLRRVLLKLAEQRVDAPGVGVPLDAVIASGWPGEKMLHEAALARAYTTIQRLRALGLANVLLTRDDGYLLDPDARVHLERKA